MQEAIRKIFYKIKQNSKIEQPLQRATNGCINESNVSMKR